MIIIISENVFQVRRIMGHRRIGIRLVGRFHRSIRPPTLFFEEKKFVAGLVDGLVANPINLTRGCKRRSLVAY